MEGKGSQTVVPSNGEAVTGALHPPIAPLGEQNSTPMTSQSCSFYTGAPSSIPEPLRIPASLLDTKQRAHAPTRLKNGGRTSRTVIYHTDEAFAETKHPDKLVVYAATYSKIRAVRPWKSPSGSVVKALESILL